MNRFLMPIIAVAISLVSLGSCGNEDDNPTGVEDNPDNVTRTILVYAVNNSSLAANFEEDSREMLEAMEKVDGTKFRLLLYSTDDDGETCRLSRAVRGEGKKYEFATVKSYDRDVTSTHPDRVAEVIGDALDEYPMSAYDLIFWGHGMSWKPYFTDHQVHRAYGGEYNPTNSRLDWAEIDELASAVPDGRFDTIWFDCCYMAGVETIYEFSGKCDTFVGYPTEVWEDGMQYANVLPYLFRDTPDIRGAAYAFYSEYDHSDMPVSVTVVNMAALEGLADAARATIALGDARPDVSTLVNYSRSRTTPLYDFEQLFTEITIANGHSEYGGILRGRFNEVVDMRLCSSLNFNYKPWNGVPSGLSTHYYRDLDTKEEDYYRTLKWYKRVYE